MAAPQFLVTRRFTDGILKGLSHTAVTEAYLYHVGFVCDKPCVGDPYVITHVTVVEHPGPSCQCANCQSVWHD